MEDTLRAIKDAAPELMESLNPCFNGRYSQSVKNSVNDVKQGLNPCFNGRYSQRNDLNTHRLT